MRVYVRVRVRERTTPRAGAGAAGGVPLGQAASPTSAEAALLNVAVNSLEALAAVLTAKPVALSSDDRAKFAAAVKKSMDAVLHCRT